MRRFDFDPEAVLHMCWRGVRPLNVDAPVRYFSAEEGGVSHFNYLRDNLLLSGMHARLPAGFLLRLPHWPAAACAPGTARLPASPRPDGASFKLGISVERCRAGGAFRLHMLRRAFG